MHHQEHALERLLRRSHHLTERSTCESANRLRDAVAKIEKEFIELRGRIVQDKIELERAVDLTRGFMDMQQYVENWLTEIEIRLIGLRPYTSDEEPRIQIQRIQV